MQPNFPEHGIKIITNWAKKYGGTRPKSVNVIIIGLRLGLAVNRSDDHLEQKLVHNFVLHVFIDD